MSYQSGHVIVDAQTGEVVGELGTGLLIQQGGGEAYQDGGFWRLRDDKYDAQLDEPPVYTRVRVRHLKQCPGAKTAWNIGHYVPYGEPVYGPRGQCYEDATYDGIPTGDELAAGRER